MQVRILLSALIVEPHDVEQSSKRAVVHVGSGQFDVPQCRSLESTDVLFIIRHEKTSQLENRGSCASELVWRFLSFPVSAVSVSKSSSRKAIPVL